MLYEGHDNIKPVLSTAWTGKLSTFYCSRVINAFINDSTALVKHESIWFKLKISSTHRI